MKKKSQKKDPKWFSELCDICISNDVETLRCFLKDNPQVDLSYRDGGLSSAAALSNLEVLEYLLTSPELRYHPDIHAEDDMALVYAANLGQIAAFDFLLYSPKLIQHANLHAQNDGVFEWAMRMYQSKYEEPQIIKNNYNFLQHLIIDVGFPRTEHVVAYLKEKPCPEIERLFEIQEDVATMQKELPLPKKKLIKQKI